MLEISVTQEQGSVPVTVIRLAGKLDGSNYNELLGAAVEAHQGGAQNILLDLAGLDYMSSAGLVCIHTIARVLRGENTESPDGWSSMRAIDQTRDSGKQRHIKLLNPQGKIAKTLELAGFDQMFEIHSDLKQAVASFS